MKRWITKNGNTIYQVLKGRSNSFLILEGSKALLVDTGRRSKRELLLKRIQYVLNDGKSLVALILTHAHFDHAENASFLRDHYKIPVYVHKEEAVFLEKGENPPIRGSYFAVRLITGLWEKKIKSLFRYEPSKHDFTVEERLDLQNLGFNAYLLHTPGHSPGSMSLIVDNEIAIVGDAMFGVIKRFIYPPFAWNPEQMINSWGKLLKTGCKLFLPAHGTANSRKLVETQYDKLLRRMKR